ncbi:MAG TPA: hypothetical protein VMT30_04755 [Candidatus Saccharimonadia bacterium]|nr:hypothetical protein [Candidatus Saccharimonadia bacterium]
MSQTVHEAKLAAKSIPGWASWLAAQLVRWYTATFICLPFAIAVRVSFHAQAWWTTHDGMPPIQFGDSIGHGLLWAALAALAFRGLVILNHHRRPVWATRRRARNAASQPRLEALPPL